MGHSGGYRRAFFALLVATALAFAGSPLGGAEARVVSDDTSSISRDGKPKQKLTLQMSTPGPVVNGSTVSFAGSGPGRLNGKKVKLYRRVGVGEWVKVGAAKLGGGAFNVSGLATGQEANSWQAVVKVKKGRKGHKRKKTYISNVVSSAMYSWYPMTTSNAVSASSRIDQDRVDIGAETFLNAFYLVNYASDNTTYYNEWNLSYKCLTFTATYGLDNHSATGASAAFSAAVDGITTPLENKGLGPASQVTLDVSTRLRIRLNMTKLTSNATAYPAYANAQVLCSATPF